MSTVELLREFQNLGCDDNIKCGVAARVYIDLMDVAKVSGVESFYDVELREIYFTGKETKDGIEACSIYLPTLSTHNLNFIQMQRFQEKLCRDDSRSVILCICDSSSIVLYYRLSNQLKQPKKIGGK